MEALKEILVPLIVVLCTSIASIIVAIINNRNVHNSRKSAEMHQSKQRIISLIEHDQLRMIRNKLPQNYQRVLEEYDDYKLHGGNSYIEDLIKEYKLDVDEFEANYSDNNN